MHATQRFLVDERGATALEYALVASLVSIVIVMAITLVGTKTSAKYSSVATEL